MRLALFQPDIAQNTGTLLRLGACLDVPVDIIEPAGFRMTDKALRRAGMDYLEHVDWRRHLCWEAFEACRLESGNRLIALSSHAQVPYFACEFRPGDILLMGRESAGLPEAVQGAADVRVTIPMRPGARSLNIATAAAMVVGEGLRQTGLWPGRHFKRNGYEVVE